MHLPQRGERLGQINDDLVIVVIVRELADNLINFAGECSGTFAVLHKTNLFLGHLLLHEL
ncbi:hypothetical protein D3C74_502300 [compost metagenome]